jgi:hypothetical protein
VVAHRTTTIGVLYRRGAGGAWLLQWSIEEEKGVGTTHALFSPTPRLSSRQQSGTRLEMAVEEREDALAGIPC